MWRPQWQRDEQRHRDAARSRLCGALVRYESARTKNRFVSLGFTTWLSISSASRWGPYTLNARQPAAHPIPAGETR